MPQIRRHNLPPALYAHLLDRVQQRSISAQQLRHLLRWMDTQPMVPQGRWLKRFPELIVCGDGELLKTFLLPNQTPTGDEDGLAGSRQRILCRGVRKTGKEFC